MRVRQHGGPVEDGRHVVLLAGIDGVVHRGDGEQEFDQLGTRRPRKNSAQVRDDLGVELAVADAASFVGFAQHVDPARLVLLRLGLLLDLGALDVAVLAVVFVGDVVGGVIALGHGDAAGTLLGNAREKFGR